MVSLNSPTRALEVTAIKVADKVTDVRSTLISMKADSRFREINNWLSPPDPSTNLNHAKERRHEGTGSWFLESEPFKEWKSGSRQCLWLHGIPGCGKTVLCSTIIEHLRQIKDPSHIVLDFFFDFKDNEKQSLDKLVRSLVVQLY